MPHPRLQVLRVSMPLESDLLQRRVRRVQSSHVSRRYSFRGVYILVIRTYPHTPSAVCFQSLLGIFLSPFILLLPSMGHRIIFAHFTQVSGTAALSSISLCTPVFSLLAFVQLDLSSRLPHCLLLLPLTLYYLLHSSLAGLNACSIWRRTSRRTVVLV